MHIDIDASPSGGLKVLRHIPGGRLQQLEGRNGIGKTVAVHLLELCTGGQPYTGMDSSWQTLREQLGHTTISVRGLRNGDELVFHLRPDEWRLEPDPPGDWLGTALRNGEKIDWSDVPNVLKVVRIGGDETLGESLAIQVSLDSDRLRILGAAQAERRRLWGDLLARVERLAGVAGGVDLSFLAEEAAAADRAYGTSRTDLDRAQAAVDQLREVVTVLERAELMEVELPRLESELVAIGAQEDEVRSRLERADADVAHLLAEAEISSAQARRVEDLEKLQRLRRDRRIRRRHELDIWARRARVETPVDLKAVALDKALIQREIDGLRQERLSIDRSGLVIELIAEVSRPVGRANNAGLGPEILAEADDGAITVAELAGGLTKRRDTLGGVKSDEARALAQDIAGAEQRLEALGELPRLVRLRDRAESDLDDTTRELDQLLTNLDMAASAAYRSALEHRSGLLDELSNLSVRRGDIEAQLAQLTSEGTYSELVESARSTLRELALPTDIDALDVGALVPEATTRVSESMEALGRALTRRDDAASRLANAEAGTRASVAALLADPAFSWLTEPEATLVPDPKATMGEQLEALTQLGRGARYVMQLLLDTLNDQQALTQALTDLAARLRSMSVKTRTAAGVLAVAVRRHYEEVFAQELDTPQVTAALFDEGRNLAVDLEEMTVSWESSRGDRQTRPLESFSSGERAFAYTRVQMERQANVFAANKLLVLDEFGAFIAQDRFEALVRYLTEDAVGQLADQILLILPLRRRIGELQGADDLESRGYIVSELDS